VLVGVAVVMIARAIEKRAASVRKLDRDERFADSVMEVHEKLLKDLDKSHAEIERINGLYYDCRNAAVKLQAENATLIRHVERLKAMLQQRESE
jgi:hypothetical protein